MLKIRNKLSLKVIVISIILTLILAVLSTPFIAAYTLFKGPPFGATIAKSKAISYASVIYDKSTIHSYHFNMKNNTYRLMIADDNKSNTIVLEYDIYSNSISDHKVSEHYKTKYEEEMNSIIATFPDNIQFTPGNLYTSVIANGKYSSDIAELEVTQSLSGSIINKDTNIPLVESRKKPAEIIEIIIDQLGEEYTITALQIHYLDINGVFEVRISHSDLNDLEGHTIKHHEIGELDQERINELKMK